MTGQNSGFTVDYPAGTDRIFGAAVYQWRDGNAPRISRADTMAGKTQGKRIITQKFSHPGSIDDLNPSVCGYGNGDHLCMKDANALRFENPDIAGELLDLRREDSVPRQISLEFPR